METLLKQLLDRWEQAFDELQTLPVYKALVKTTQYSDGLRYDIANFDWKSFSSDGMMTQNKDGLTSSLYEYGFNSEGLPCYVKYRHDYNNITWEGFYAYADSFVEYVEFCVNTGVPSALTRIEFEEGRKISFQRIIINSRGGAPFLSQMPKEEIISSIKNDTSSIILTVTGYEYSSAGTIERSSSTHITPGIGKSTSYDEYGYDENQILDTIRTFYEQGTNQLSYCRLPENVDADSLIKSLAEAMAKEIAQTLANQDVAQPIALLELSYHYADNYIPLLVYQTTEQVAEKLHNKELVFANEYYDALDVDVVSFERLFAQLEQLMKERDDRGLGTHMLREAAKILTQSKLFGELNTSEDFAAYAIDWSIEGHSDADFEEILVECGVKMETIENWGQIGMLPG